MITNEWRRFVSSSIYNFTTYIRRPLTLYLILIVPNLRRVTDLLRDLTSENFEQNKPLIVDDLTRALGALRTYFNEEYFASIEVLQAITNQIDNSTGIRDATPEELEAMQVPALFLPL